VPSRKRSEEARPAPSNAERALKIASAIHGWPTSEARDYIAAALDDAEVRGAGWGIEKSSKESFGRTISGCDCYVVIRALDHAAVCAERRAAK